MTASSKLELNQQQKVIVNRSWQLVQMTFNVINHILIAIVVTFMSILCYRMGNMPISWHVWLSVVGYQLLMTEAILSFYPQNVWTMSFSRSTQRSIHWILQILGSLTALAGMVSYFISRNQESKGHFMSVHSIFGLVAGFFTFISLFNGIGALWSIELKSFAKPVYFKLLHNVSGIATFVLGMIALALGYDRCYMRHNLREDVRLWLQAFAILTVILALFGAVRTSRNYVRNILSN